MAERDCNTYFEELEKAKSQISENASIIGSFEGQLKGVDTRVEDSTRQAVADFKRSIEFKSYTRKTFMSGSKCFRERCLEAGLDVAPVDKLIRRDFSSKSSNRVASALGVRAGLEKNVVEVDDPTAEEEVSPDQAAVFESAPKKSSRIGFS